MATKDFHHPYQPYTIQQQFMEALFDCIDKSQVGIFESPTGTGKSLSLICGSLTWLREQKRRLYENAVAEVSVGDDDPEWMVEHAREEKRRELQRMRGDFEDRLEAVRQQERRVRERHARDQPSVKRQKRNESELQDPQNDDNFVLEDYNSDDEPSKHNGKTAYSTEKANLMEQLGILATKKTLDRPIEEDEELKIYFCSRTHSQLSQFVGELQRLRMPLGWSLGSSSPEVQSEESALKHLPLGSRKNLCINSKVLRLKDPTVINERCIELQQSKTAASHKCPYIPGKDNENTVLDFRDHALARIRDIEDLSKLGTKLEICPYYASRSAIGPAEIVTLPYPLLLQRSAREALGISLKGHVVIIDEAHNLLNAIEGTHSVQISESQLRRARESLMTYLQKFSKRLKGSNRVYVTQVVRVIDSLLHFTSGIATRNELSGVVEPNRLLAGKGVDQINLTKLVRYISESKLARKVEGYVAHLAAASTVPGAVDSIEDVTPRTPTLTHVQNFVTALMNPAKEGRFFWARELNTYTIKYLLLDPSEHFRDIVQDARAVILAGGTMSPMDEYRQQLFPYLPELRTFSCGHLIPSSNLLVRAIATDKDGRLELNFKTRDSNATMCRIGRAILAIAPHVRGGLVVFFPSYGFLEQVSACWRSNAISKHFEQMKPVFSDSRGVPAEETFKAYGQAVETSGRGAILLSVIGGKLSEGINFSDDLGRCVVVVGLPFPNLQTPEWKAKMQYIDEKAAVRGVPKGSASREHAENVCMRSVNQAIGRVIRHKNDWASIILLDERYTQQRIRGKLPAWIKESFSVGSTGLLDVVEDVRTFFSER